MIRTTTFLLIVTLLAPLSGCSNREENEKSKLVGKWVREDSPKDVLALFKDGTGMRRTSDGLEYFSWNAESGCLVFVGSLDPSDTTLRSSVWAMYDYRLSGSILILTNGTIRHEVSFTDNMAETRKKITHITMMERTYNRAKK